MSWSQRKASSSPSMAATLETTACVTSTGGSSSEAPLLLYTQSSPSFTLLLVSSVWNRKFCIVTPTDASHVQASVVCGRRHDVRVRVRSGGHDFEGLSYRSERPEEVSAVVDLAKLRSVIVDREAATAWVGSGATLGELYYAISKASDLLAFPAGMCPTVGVGGHFSGGGFGMLLRKYGLAADNVLDATLVDAKGRLLDRQAMGTDVFWARGRTSPLEPGRASPLFRLILLLKGWMVHAQVSALLRSCNFGDLYAQQYMLQE